MENDAEPVEVRDSEVYVGIGQLKRMADLQLHFEKNVFSYVRKQNLGFRQSSSTRRHWNVVECAQNSAFCTVLEQYPSTEYLCRINSGKKKTVAA